MKTKTSSLSFRLMSNTISYTINCDLGEGIPHEAQIISWIDVASVACGGHFGDRHSINTTLNLVKNFGKKAGAHPSYPDLLHFGRNRMKISLDALIQSVADQIALFNEVATSQNIPFDHIKFHGALYNEAAENRKLAESLVAFLKENHSEIPLLVPPDSELEKAALQSQLPVRREIFADRAYQDDYRLLSRAEEGSLFTEGDQVIAHLNEILLRDQIQAHSGKLIPISGDTLCFHGDNPGILEILPKVRRRFWK